MGAGRMRTNGHRSISPQMGGSIVQDGATGGRAFLVTAGLGVLTVGIGCLLQTGRWRRSRQPSPQTIGRQIDVVNFGNGNQRLGLVRRNAGIRQCTDSPGVDPNRTDDTHAIVRRGWPSITPLAHCASDYIVGIFQAGRNRQLRAAPPEAGGVRSATRRGGGDNIRLPCRVASGRRYGVANSSVTRVRMVSGRKRPPGGAHRSGNGQLFGRTSSGPR